MKVRDAIDFTSDDLEEKLKGIYTVYSSNSPGVSRWAYIFLILHFGQMDLHVLLRCVNVFYVTYANFICSTKTHNLNINHCSSKYYPFITMRSHTYTLTLPTQSSLLMVNIEKAI